MMVCAHNVEFAEIVKVVDAKTEKAVGEIMTILEAVIPGDRQAEASKATVKRILWSMNRDVKMELEKLTIGEVK